MELIHLLEGQVGHAFVIVSFVSSLLGVWAFYAAIKNKNSTWLGFAEKAYYVHIFAVLGIVFTLFYLINSQYFEYHYVFSHSSKLLPVYYQISCFWEGQEGSFLLWMFWNAFLGLIVLKTAKTWKPSVMLVVCLTQAFLASMILGVIVFDIKIGSSPFMLLREVIDAPIFLSNPDFIPADGNGLNPLLQNYWMVIHPPMLFLGFASTVFPFAFCIAGLITGNLKDWVRPAIPWIQFSTVSLGVGILMGAYWAYETLNFGGYWNWDPVENAIYIPWLILVAAMHVMMIYNKKGETLKLSFILVIASFILVLYSTFLTRSGILGNASVHSFTDLGLSGQLLIYLLFFLVFSIVLLIWRWSYIPTSKKEMSLYSNEFWVIIGAVALCLMSFQVLVGTSIPVYNEIASLFGVELNMAPPTDIVQGYSMPQLYFAAIIAFLSGTAQFFWWKRIDKTNIRKVFIKPFIITLVISGSIIVIVQIASIPYILLTVAVVYSVVTNTMMLLEVRRRNAKINGGAVAHIGIALMLIGILFSSGFTDILSTNYTSMVWSKNFPDEVNRDNLLLFINEPRRMQEYELVYRGKRKLSEEKGMVNENDLQSINDPLRRVDKEGDTLFFKNPENTYFEIAYLQESILKFTLYPRVQVNKTMDMTVYSPDILHNLTSDVYTHVRVYNVEEDAVWSEPQEIEAEIGGRFFINDYVAQLERMQTIDNIAGVQLGEEDIAVKAVVKIKGEFRDYLAEPIFVIHDRELVGRIEVKVDDLAVKITIKNILPEDNKVLFEVETTQKDWVILEAVRKPWINLLWIGCILMIIGFVIAIRNRLKKKA